MKRVNLELPDDLLARIDEARKTPTGTVARNEWLRRAVESYLEQYIRRVPLEDIEPYLADFRVLPRDRPTATTPPERPVGLAIQQAARSSSQAKRGVEPRPKKAR